jgi:hypothetical protein
MKIHSSSLTHTHASLSRQQVGKQSSARNKDEKELPSVKNVSDHNNPHYPSTPSEEIRPVLEISGLSSTFPDKNNSVPLRDTRVLRALTAYSQEFNKPLADQNSRVAQGIDTYV